MGSGEAARRKTRKLRCSFARTFTALPFIWRWQNKLSATWSGLITDKNENKTKRACSTIIWAPSVIQSEGWLSWTNSRKERKLFSAPPSTPTIISTNFYSSHKELGKALFMYQTRLNTSKYLWRQNNREQLKIRELQSLAKLRLRARSRKKGTDANREKKIY